jgi:hypothetical protein
MSNKKNTQLSPGKITMADQKQQEKLTNESLFSMIPEITC